MPTKQAKKKTKPAGDKGGPRPFWSGTLTFGLVSVPVDLYPGNKSNRIPLRMLSPDGEPLARRYYSEKTGNDLDDKDMVRGFEFDKEKYVVVTDEELERLAPEQSRDIDLRRFVDLESLPPMYFDRSYFLAPSEGSEKAYKLLSETMDKEELAGLATFVMRGKEYLVAIFAENGILRAETMRFADQVRSAKQIGLPEKKSVSAAKVKAFETIITKHSAKTLPLTKLKDHHSEQLLKLIAKKRKQPKTVVKVESAVRTEGKVVDLMAVLKKSLAGKKRAAA